MKVGMYSVRDVKLDRSNIPFYARNDREAQVIILRSNLPESIYKDTILYKVGEFDDDTGLISSFNDQIDLLPYPAKENL